MHDVRPLNRKCESVKQNYPLSTGGIHYIMAATILVSLLVSVTLVRCEELRFLVVGDWGGESDWWPYTTPYETAVSRGMGKIAQQLGTQFTVALGRNFVFAI